MSNHTERTVIRNKKAFFDYKVLERIEAGLVLQGPEVKSIRLGNANLKGNFVHMWHNELWVEGVHIGRYPFAHIELPERRKRKLLVKKKELEKIARLLQEKGVTAVLLSLYFKGPYVKGEIGLVRGKKLFDKRESIKRRDEDRRMKTVVKNFGR